MKDEPKKDSDARGEDRRFRVAYLKISLGLTIKEIAGRLSIGESLADHYWASAKRKIRGARS